MKKITAFLTMLTVLLFIFTGCGNSDSEKATGEKTLNASEAFAIETLNPHAESQGWYTSIYGVTESLFKMADDSSVEPMLAESATQDGNVWTVKLNANACFSNGDPVTADMVIRNLQDAANTNTRYAYLLDYTYEAVDDNTLTITTNEVYPTLINDLANPELAIVDLDNSGEMNDTLIATGPFMVSSFEPGGTVEVVKNDNYWNGDVQLDGAVFYYMPDSSTSMTAMQNGEIDAYTSVTADAAEIFEKDPDTYTLTTIPATRLQFYILNVDTLDDSVRAAINLTVDGEAIASYLNGTVTATVGPFSSDSAYGQVTKPSVNTDEAKSLLEDDGYTMNSDGYYEKDGEELTLNVGYYAARSLDTVATVMQEELKAVGIKAELNVEEDPDSTYIATGDFDVALYCMIADLSCDPYYFINATIADGATYNCGGFESADAQSLIDQLKVETDIDKRADLANQIVQIAIDDNAFGYVALFNKITVTRNGVSNVGENCPFDFYFLNADTDMN